MKRTLHQSTVIGCLFASFQISFSLGLFDYIAFIAMIILKDQSTLTGTSPKIRSLIARSSHVCNRPRVGRVQLHSGCNAVWVAAQSQTRHNVAAFQSELLEPCPLNMLILFQRVSAQVSATPTPATAVISPTAALEVIISRALVTNLSCCPCDLQRQFRSHCDWRLLPLKIGQSHLGCPWHF